MNAINSALLCRFMKIAGDRVDGDWVIIGGAVMQIIGESTRVTVDIDLAGPDTATQSDTLKLMEVAELIGLPVEAINQAGAFFLRKIPDWSDQLVVLHRGKRAVFFRPNATLFILLKLARFSETDASDCQVMIGFAKAQREAIDQRRILAAIEAEVGRSRTKDRVARLTTFRLAMSAGEE